MYDTTDVTIAITTYKSCDIVLLVYIRIHRLTCLISQCPIKLLNSKLKNQISYYHVTIKGKVTIFKLDKKQVMCPCCNISYFTYCNEHYLYLEVVRLSNFVII